MGYFLSLCPHAHTRLRGIPITISEMFWSADQGKQLSNQSVNSESREVRPIQLLIVCRHYLTVDQVITDQY